MTKKHKIAAPSVATKRRITIERMYKASIEELWELWTTTYGVEMWWMPEGFDVKVPKLDLRPGGDLEYTMTATAPAQIDFMTSAGLPLTSAQRVTYTEVAPRRHLAYEQVVDYLPGVEPYVVATLVELNPVAHGVQLVLTFDAMHDEPWTQRAVTAWESELGKLADALGG